MPSRISSTWGGALENMVRATLPARRIITEDRLLENARARGDELLRALEALALEFLSRIL